MIGEDSRYHHVEECDDGNKKDDDGCSSTCLLEPGYSCVTTIDGAQDCSVPDSEFFALQKRFPMLTGALHMFALQDDPQPVGWSNLMVRSADPSRPTQQVKGLFKFGHSSTLSGNDATNPDFVPDLFSCPCGQPGNNTILDRMEGIIIEPGGAYSSHGPKCVWHIDPAFGKSVHIELDLFLRSEYESVEIWDEGTWIRKSGEGDIFESVGPCFPCGPLRGPHTQMQRGDFFRIVLLRSSAAACAL